MAITLDGSNGITTPGGATTDDITFADNDKAIFGAGSDLQIYHDGSNSYIKDVGTGNLTISANQVVVKNAASNEAGILFTENSAVELYHDDSKKLETTSTGVTVTGVMTANGTVNSAQAEFGTSSNRPLIIQSSNVGGYADDLTEFHKNSGVGQFSFSNTGGEMMRIDSIGAVTMPSQPAFMAVKNAGQLNMPVNTYNTVTFGNEVFDRNADYDGSTTFTAPVTGVYQANIKIRIDQIDNQANYYLIRLQTSNRHYYTITDFDGASTDPTYSTFSFSQLVDMDAGDTAYIQAYQAGGSAQSDYDNDSGSSQFSMFLVA